MRRRRKSNGLLRALGTLTLAVVAGAAVMFLAIRLELLKGGVPGAAPAQTLVSAAATASPSAAVSATATPGTRPGGTMVAAPSAAPTPTRPRPLAADTARAYLEAWEQQRYPDMYRLLSSQARQRTAEDRFVTRYQAITVGATINSLKGTLAPLVEPAAGVEKAEARYSATFASARLGEFKEENVLPLVLENGEWRVDWTPSLIFQDLTPDRSVRFYPDDPVRGAIVDRNNVPLAAQGKILTLGFVPGRVKDQNLAVQELSKYLGVSPDVIRQKFANSQPDWWVPLRDFPPDKRDELTQRFANVEGVIAEEKDGRIYPAGPVAAHVVGFVSPVNLDDLKTLAPKGYEEGELVGRTGVESAEEEILGGLRGGRLQIESADGEVIRTIADRPAKNGGTIKLTIDIEIQKKAEAVLGEKVGSLVMMDPRDNSIVALVSKPSFDPNGFIYGFSEEDWKKLSEDPRRPFQPRANLSTYPIGSVFKVVTMAAGLEKAGYETGSQFTCNGRWSLEGASQVWGDWIPTGHGKLDLSQGLVESCDIVFYELGNKLNQLEAHILSDFARKFGFGSPTGMEGLQEAEGVVPGPEWKKEALRQEWFPGDAVNFSIGQGYLDATPLQVANLYSTLANGGTLRTPVLVKSITPGDGTPAREFSAQEKHRVPVSSENIARIHEALTRVASTPRGTANYAFKGYRIPIAAKTGSAENQNPDAHAWFAGYGPADKPTLVTVVMVEGGRTGGEVAAPLGRQAFEIVLGK